ncbi:laminin subunit beta-1 isoform X2 [Aethina tumida]|uniref:laminin subunit beta-1 isoform X2 n=1 Tax=Aethina tumida TaxID=116153 RepID=UPI0021473E38|nr:laminin subunit beta-1 isoform X2 [Aethina tumida]
MYRQSSGIWFLIFLQFIFLTETSPQFQYSGNRQRFRGNKGVYEPRKPHPCEQSSCYPATGNLLIGREKQLYASSTCGLEKQERYCIVSHLEDRKKCFWCDSSARERPGSVKSHNISNIVYRVFPGTNQKTWWQSENGKENVYIQLDLEAEFHFTHMIITFKTFRPAAMLIERSDDFGKNWQVYRYFAHNCTESFPGVRQGDPTNLTDVICESRYSGIDPLTDGEIIYKVIPRTVSILNPYSEQVQSLLKMTNLRINFTKLHTLGDDLLDKRAEIQEKYYYAITDMVVRGSCSCYGHANRCLPLPGIKPKADMVHGRCECTHNTKGRNCEQCEDFFNDLPWRPAIGKQSNACKRCNCNNHATSCHYDPALYEATGQVSGGVCDGCEHNTMGSNCEQCKPFYYRDPTKDIQDPEVCRECDCDPRGSLEGGSCDSITDTVNGLVAGKCHCKANVEGRRCDGCKNGYWNFTEANPEGCQPCTCNTLGTVDNQGCNVDYGTCTCKRYVTGSNCDQCLPEYWGLSEQDYGCSPCDCDMGGSYDNNCDVITGQCRCRDFMTGRTCDTPAQQYYTVNLDFLLYEAENAQSNGQVLIREPFRDGHPNTWTGEGFNKVTEGNYMEFVVDDIKTSTDYDIIIRYEPLLPGAWEDVDVTIHRPDYIDPNGPCKDYDLINDKKRVALLSDRTSIKVVPSSCLEANKVYKVTLEFRRYSFDKETPSASVLIDSIVLIPSIDKLPIFHGSVAAEDRLAEYTRYNCDELMHNAYHTQIPEICKKYHVSIGAYFNNGAASCQCDPTGSTSKLCNSTGGYCQCKPNVVGRKCDRCAPGTYGFGPEGCKACDCNSIGSLDNFCNVTTGQCKCRANTYGRECDQCRTGFWNFPNCQRCDCNGHADICDARTGACISCRDSTEGHYCEKCVKTFYGDPRIGVDIPCRPCPCPGSPGSNHSYADNCSLDPYSKDVICDCKEGYAGLHCDVCSDNYFGNPEVPGGSCQPCDCSGKINYLTPGNCDPHTGKCKNCLDDTTGDHCEVCRPGFFRYGPDERCQPCQCFILGSNATAGACNPEGGQCNCYPNVAGITCDECIEFHWKIASGEGCEPCDCDPQGSLSPQCNEFDGQCECARGFGGRQCNECMRNFYGDPRQECKPCDCDPYGSKTSQCDMVTGACVCKPGIGGYRCDVCARGYIGDSPNCQPCGECFDNWDRILGEVRNNTLDIIERAGDIKKVGATGAYTKEFEDMQNQLDEAEQLLNNTDDINVEGIEQELLKLRNQINQTEYGKLKDVEELLDNTKENQISTTLKLERLNLKMIDLQTKTKELEENGTQLQEANVRGALNLIKSAKNKADAAANKAQHTLETIKEADVGCKATENHLNTTEKFYKQQLETNKNALNSIVDKINSLNDQIPELNHLVCDGSEFPCDEICGGAGCGSCGNQFSCENGAKQLAETAVSIANNTETTLRNKESEANEFIRNISHINTQKTRDLSQEVFDKIRGNLISTNDTLNNATELLNDMKEFLGQNHTQPEELNEIIDQILDTEMKYNRSEVEKLAQQIKESVDRLANTDKIIEATKHDLQKVNQLKMQALERKEQSQKLLNEAEEIKTSLNITNEKQKEASDAIDTAWRDYEQVESRLYEIGNKTQEAQVTTSEISNHIHEMKQKLNELQANTTNNGIYADKIMEESVNIMKNAEKTQDDFNQLKDKYNNAKDQLHQDLNRVKLSKERSKELITKAFALGDKVTKTLEDIQKLENSSRDDLLSVLENKLNGLILNMNRYTNELQGKVDYYKQCT